MKSELIRKELLEHHIDVKTANTATAVLDMLELTESMKEFRALSAGMTNRLFYLRSSAGSRLLRLPGEETAFLVNREQEAKVYHDLAGLHITDRVFYINADNGIKVTEFIEEAHSCNPEDAKEVANCMAHLRKFHEQRLSGYLHFNLRERLLSYEEHIRHDPAQYLPDYRQVREKVMARLSRVEEMDKESVLCHIDAVHDNFIINEDKLRLIDWEYAAECDPHVDVAMFCIYAGYDAQQINETIDTYFADKPCPETVREKIFHYTAICGFLWALWCEIKRDAGVTYDDYAKVQYNYAR